MVRHAARTEEDARAPAIPHREPTGGTGTAAAARPRRGGPLGKVLAILGPGFITGASDDDPSGIATYASAGAALGFAPLWTALVTFPLMAAVQFICAKTAMVTGRGMAGVIRQRYPRTLLYTVVLALLLANTINAGTDLGAIAAAIGLFLPIP